MPILFWVFIAAGYLGGAALCFFLSRRFIARVSADTAAPTHIRRAGMAAGAVAALPALFFATVLGGNLGGAIAARVVESLSSIVGVRQIVTGFGIGFGVLCVLTLIVVSTAVAGAVFMKVYLARGERT